jgi:hypothetical protein
MFGLLGKARLRNVLVVKCEAMLRNARLARLSQARILLALMCEAMLCNARLGSACYNKLCQDILSKAC